ncbi:MAG: GNAT family N-acetyltransferase [Thermomicrobiales bacterium]
MTVDRVELIAPGANREPFLDLLLLADESEQQVRSYMNEGDLFAFFADGANDPAGMILVVPLEPGEVELKAVAIRPDVQSKGLGKRMLVMVLAELAARGDRRAVVGTGNSGIGQLAFYQKAGFRLHHIERDFFSPERGYNEGIEENGIPLKDMVWMDLDLQRARP